MRGKTNIGGGNVIQGKKILCTVQDNKSLRKGDFFQYVTSESQANGKQLANGYSNNAEQQRYVYNLSDGRFLLIRGVSSSETYSASGSGYYVVASIISITDGYINEDYSLKLDNTNIVPSSDGGTYRACQLSDTVYVVAVTCNRDSYKNIQTVKLTVDLENSTISAIDGYYTDIGGHYNASNYESFSLIPVLASTKSVITVYYKYSNMIYTQLYDFSKRQYADRSFSDFTNVNLSGDGLPADNYYSAPLGMRKAWTTIALQEGKVTSNITLTTNMRALLALDYPTKIMLLKGKEYSITAGQVIELNNIGVVYNQFFKLNANKALLLQKQHNGTKIYLNIINMAADDTLSYVTKEVSLSDIDANNTYITDSAIALTGEDSGYMAVYALDTVNMIENLYTVPFTITNDVITLGAVKNSMSTAVANTHEAVTVGAFTVNSNGKGLIAHDYVDGANQKPTRLYALDVEADGLGITGRYPIIKPYEDVINGVTNQSGGASAIITAYVPESEA